MGHTVLTVFFTAVVAVTLGGTIKKKHAVTQEPLLMPDVHPTKDDTYLCKALKLDKDSINIIKFNPQAKKEIAHHILIYGCSEPGTKQDVWNCGEMSKAEADTSQYEFGGVCKAGSKIIYAWAMDAPSLSLPKGVGFEVGQGTSSPYLVLQVHYKDTKSFRDDDAVKDRSGVILDMTTRPMPHPAGVYLLGTAGELPPHRTVYMETACVYDFKQRIFPFAYRTHTHKHGKVVSGYRIRNGKWAEIGRRDPHDPQMFYNVSDPSILKSGIKRGDILAARCTMVNDENRAVFVGATQKDEMCNFYVMYYMQKQAKPLPDTACFRSGPPNWYWPKDSWSFWDVPRDASVVPGTNEKLIENADLGDFEEYQFLK